MAAQPAHGRLGMNISSAHITTQRTRKIRDMTIPDEHEREAMQHVGRAYVSPGLLHTKLASPLVACKIRARLVVDPVVVFLSFALALTLTLTLFTSRSASPPRPLLPPTNKSVELGRENCMG